MNSDDHTQTATTVKELGIHVGYVREDITEVKDLLRQHIELAATKADLVAAVARIDKVERREKNYITTKQFYGWIVGTGTIAGVVLSIWVFIEKVRGV